MTEIETAVGSAVKVTCAKDELTQALSLVGRAVSTRATVQVLGGVLLRAADGPMDFLRPTWSCRSGSPSRPRSRATAQSLLRDGCSSTWRDCCRRARSSSSTGRSTGVLEVTCGPASYKLNTYSAEDFPKLPDVDGHADVRRRQLCVPRDGVARGARRVAGRVAPCADRRSRPLRGREADHGRNGLVPDVREGDGARGRRRVGARGDRARPRAHRALADRAGLRRAADRRPGESRRVRRRRRLADDTPHRRPVPELQAAPAGDVRARGGAAARGVPGGRSAQPR